MYITLCIPCGFSPHAMFCLCVKRKYIVEWREMSRDCALYQKYTHKYIYIIKLGGIEARALLNSNISLHL